MSKPVASFLLAQILVAGVVALTLLTGTTPTIVAGGQTTPTLTSTPGPTVTPLPTPPLTPTPPGPPTTVNDGYTTTFQTTLDVPAPGVLANDQSNGGGSMTAQQVTGPAHGSAALTSAGGFTYTPFAGYAGTDSFTYRAVNASGPGNVATVTIGVSDPTNVQPPTNLYTAAVAGNLVTLRWDAPAIGPAPSSFVIEGGLHPGEVLAAIPTGSPYPIFTFAAPTGSFYVRAGSVLGSSLSVPSNEIQLHVNVPVPPSAPAGLVGLVDGSNLALAWRNTFEGGAPTSLLLDVSGAVVATLPMGRSDTFAYAGVPAGTYTLRVRAANAAGPSAPSNALTLAFPGPCSGVPEAPVGVLAFRTGNTVFVVWDPSPTGPAPTGYLLNVAGTFSGAFPTTSRGLSGVVGPGTYDLSVRGTNSCGSGAASSVHSITVP